MYRNIESKYLHMPADLLTFFTSTYDQDAGEFMGLVHKIFCHARASLLQSCTRHPPIPSEYMPRCSTWPGLAQWISQIMACGSDQYKSEQTQTDYFWLRIVSFTAISRDTRVISPDPAGNPRFIIDPEYLRWEKTVDLPEVLDLISWFIELGEGLVPYPNCLHYSSQFGSLVEQAMERAERLGLCSQRVWSLGSVLPGRELSLLGLIPPLNFASPSWRHNSHPTCTPDYCDHSTINFTSVEQLHLCAVRETCQVTKGLFSQDILLRAFKRRQSNPETFIPTAWRLDGKSIAEPGERVMAISHVWSDGTGAGTWKAGQVNTCLWEFFCDMAKSQNCKGIWWDTVCLPIDKAARIEAINKMQDNYSHATITLVHDRYLSTHNWVDAATACFAVVMSSWYTRGWTALELQRSPVDGVFVVFSNGGKPILKNLESEILVQRGCPAYRHHQLATALIRKLREPVRFLNDILMAIGPRYTSWTKDKAIIAALLVDVEDPASKSQEQIYRDILTKLQEVAKSKGGHGTISQSNLHHGTTTMKGNGFSWCPPDLFKIPRGDGYSELFIQENGDLLGMWQFRCLSRYAAYISVPEGTHPLIQSKLYVALADPHRHVLLLEGHTPDFNRAIIVKVRNTRAEVAARQYDREALYCEFVGSVIFRSTGEQNYHLLLLVRIGDPANLVELTPHERACQIGMFKRGPWGGPLGTAGASCVCWDARPGLPYYRG